MVGLVTGIMLSLPGSSGDGDEGGGALTDRHEQPELVASMCVAIIAQS